MHIRNAGNINLIIEKGYTILNSPSHLVQPGAGRFIKYIKIKNLANVSTTIEMFGVDLPIEFEHINNNSLNLINECDIKRLLKDKRLFVDVIDKTDSSETPISQKGEDFFLFYYPYYDKLIIKSETKCVLFMKFEDR